MAKVDPLKLQKKLFLSINFRFTHLVYKLIKTKLTKEYEFYKYLHAYRLMFLMINLCTKFCINCLNSGIDKKFPKKSNVKFNTYTSISNKSSFFFADFKHFQIISVSFSYRKSVARFRTYRHFMRVSASLINPVHPGRYARNYSNIHNI